MRADGRSSFIYTSFVCHLFSRIVLSLKKKKQTFFGQKLNRGSTDHFSVSLFTCECLCFCLNYIFVFSLSVRQMVHCDMFENRFSIFLHSKYGKWWMCAKMLSYCLIRKCMRASHRTDSLSFIFLSYSSSPLDCFQTATTKTFFFYSGGFFFWFRFLPWSSAPVVVPPSFPPNHFRSDPSFVPINYIFAYPLPHREMA